ncbi:eCIS core domain-containing protein [Natrinema altunense]|uniref:DUF4157 domain-containing protein n=1 Tax=Natrinema altunense TaxID=222984 RepID=A0A482Y3Q4_9EURY|nr:DUF4157 domain-containing protein [Natrinema altunense]RZH67397.1 DUF4157 domain-containing protein [Natrinema altunense]
MGFRSTREATTTGDDRRSRQIETVRSLSDHESDAGSWAQRMPLAEAEEQYGMSIPNEETLFELQRLEASNPVRVHEWIEEGMTVEDMRDPTAAEAFRERQAARPEAVPNDIERRNKRSVLRSEKAAAATEPAGDAGVPDPVREVLQSTGQPLDDGIQQAMEERMGDSFGDVRIHADATAAKACEEINARAFTVGNHIAFNHGEYDPESPAGQHILAHELAHVRQQTGADISMMPQDDSGLAIDPDPQLEREADDAAQQALADGPVTINRMGSEMQIQRAAKGEAEYVTKDEVLEIVDNYYRGHVNDQADSDPTAAGPERGTARGSLEQSGNAAERSGFVGSMREAWENTKSVGSDLTQAMTRGSIGSLAGAGGKLIGTVGGGSLGALLGGAVGSLAGPIGTGAGAATGYQVGQTLGGELLGGAASDVAKQVTDYTLPKEHAASVADLHQKYKKLEDKIERLENERESTGSELTGVGQGGQV